MMEATNEVGDEAVGEEDEMNVDLDENEAIDGPEVEYDFYSEVESEDDDQVDHSEKIE